MRANNMGLLLIKCSSLFAAPHHPHLRVPFHVCCHLCNAHARPCLSTGWVLNRRFDLTCGTQAVLAQGGVVRFRHSYLPFVHIWPKFRPTFPLCLDITSCFPASNTSSRNFTQIPIVSVCEGRLLPYYPTKLFSYLVEFLMALPLTINVVHAAVDGSFAPTTKGMARNAFRGGTLQKLL